MGSAAIAPATIYYVSAVTRSDRYTDPAQVPAQHVAIVLGAGVLPDGSPTPMLADRVEAAVQLYQMGRVKKLLMTGDNSRTDYDEVSVMQRYASDRGVPAADITLDYAGFSTYESCYRAREIFGVTQAVVITQQFHLSRAVYTCRQLGVNAIGLGTPDWGRYGDEVMKSYSTREALATVKAVLEVNLIRPQPTFLGQFEGIK
nr:ElyC/SanA/YdcF family protein [Coleofasciculus sp. FACHB-1120]